MIDTIEYNSRIEKVLNALVCEIDVPESKYRDAEDRYRAVGNWLNSEKSALSIYSPEIYAQGSFALGTVVRPLGDSEYDIDAVCKLNATTSNFSQAGLKNAVGNRLKEHETYKNMLDPQEGGRRCWTLKYADSSKFHLDILPSIPDNPQFLISMGVPAVFAKEALRITDKKTWDTTDTWPRSNPRGYRNWFQSRMKIRCKSAIASLTVDNIHGEVEEVPVYAHDTVLQRLIKLLKRHRDVKYGTDDDRPISIIITTLAARAYSGEDTLISAVTHVIPAMRAAIDKRNDSYWIANPVDPAENFADKWAEKPHKAQVFFEWLDLLIEEFNNLLTPSWRENVVEFLTDTFKVEGDKFSSTATKILGTPSFDNSVLVASHQQHPHWPISLTYRVSLVLRAGSSSTVPWRTYKSGAFLDKGRTLHFYVETNTPKPFDIYWQVVNTGEEAKQDQGLRGDIQKVTAKTDSSGCFIVESTKYKGRHWAICYIVKNNRCVAKSTEFVVNIP